MVQDRQNGIRKTLFDITIGSTGWFDIMRWLVQKVRAEAAKAPRRQRKASRRADSLAVKVSPARQRIDIKVLIRNAVRTSSC